MIKRLIGAWVIVLFFSAVYCWRLSESVEWNSDWARDLYDMARMSRGEFQVVGPPLSGGLFAGPYYYWMLVPGLILSDLNEIVPAVENAVFFALSLGAVYLAVSQVFGVRAALAFVGLLGTNPFWVTQARHPANGFTYLPILLLVYIFVLIKKEWSNLGLMLLGWLIGLVLNFHPVGVFTGVPVMAVVTLGLKNKLRISWLFMGIALAFVPLIAFEIKNGWPIMKGLVVHRRFEIFSNPTLNPYLQIARPGVIANSVFLAQEIGLMTKSTVWASIIACMGLMIAVRKISRVLLITIVGVASGFGLTVLALTKVYMWHYLFPVVLFALAGCALYVTSTKWNGVVVALLLGLNIVLFPTEIWQSAERNGEHARLAVSNLVQSGAINVKEEIAVMGVTSLPIYVPYGHEYRYFLIKEGFNPLPVSDYYKAQKLVVFSEIGRLTEKQLATWETEQFGKEYMVNPEVFREGRVTVLMYRKI